MQRRLSIFVSVLVMALLVGTYSFAATVVQFDLPRLVDESDLIVVADVAETSSNLEDDGRVYTTTILDVDVVLHGKAPDQLHLRQIGGRDGDIVTRAPGVPEFDDNERVLLFLRNIDGQFSLTGLSQGKFQIALGPDDETEFAIPRVSDSHLVPPQQADDTTADDFDPMSHQDTFHRVHDYEEFRNRIERLLKAQREGDQ